MKLYRNAEKNDVSHLVMQLKRASGNIRNHLPHGFESIVNFGFGDIFVSDTIFSMLNHNVCQEIDITLDRMAKEDYGIIDDETREANLESRYLGNGKDIVGKYQISIGCIEITIFDTYTYINDIA